MRIASPNTPKNMKLRICGICPTLAITRRLFDKIKRAHGGAALGAGIVLIPQIMGPQGQAQAPSAPLIVCPKCHAYVPATAKFCPQCGTPLKPPVSATIICPKCAHFIPASSRFCPECGIQLAHTTTQLGT